MKVLFIEAKKKSLDVDIDLSNLPAKVHIAYSIQYKDLAEKIKKKLKSRVSGFSQALGCTKLNAKHAILLVGSGKFHAIQLALSTNKPVYILEGPKITKLDDLEVEKFKTQVKTQKLKFLSASQVGILISTKPGQQNLKKALNLAKKLKKKSYLFLFDTLNKADLDNFPLSSWINTACPAIILDSNKIINAEEIQI
ncbi:MAG: diphthamide synthesis protein [archaeon]